MQTDPLLEQLDAVIAAHLPRSRWRFTPRPAAPPAELGEPARRPRLRQLQRLVLAPPARATMAG